MTSIVSGYHDSKQLIKPIEQYYIDKYKPTLNSKLVTKVKLPTYDSSEMLQHSNIISPQKNIQRTNNAFIFNIIKNDNEVTEYYIEKQIQEVKKFGNSKFGRNKISTMSPTKTRSRAANLIVDINEDIKNELTNSKQLNYACKSVQNKKAFIQQNVQFLSWILQHHYTRRSINLLKLINHIVVNTKLLDIWHDFLKEKEMSNDTIRGRFNNISVLIQLFNSSLTNSKDNVDKCIKYCRIITKKCEYNMNEFLSKISTIDYINKGLLPKNLKSDLLKMWKMVLPLIHNILLLSKTVSLRKKLYSLLLRCILFGFWAENANGRMRAVISMTLDQYMHMCRKNYNSSSETKTIKQHGRQLVSLCSNSDLLVYLKMYVKIVRPQIEIKCNQISDKQYLFLK